MTAPGTLLDLPDEPSFQWRGARTGLLGAAAVLAAGVVAARTFALGGSIRPWLAVQAVLAVPAMLVAWLLIGPHRRRTWITAGVMVAGLLLQGVAASGATPSPARLSRMIDSFGLPGETVRDVHVGNGRCRPACSEVRRVSIARNIAYAKARARIEGLMRAHGFTVTMYGHHAGEPERIDAEKDKLRVQFELRVAKLGETHIAHVWIADGPTPDNEVG